MRDGGRKGRKDEEKVVERERGKKRTKGTTRGKNERLKERQRDGKRRSKGSTARHAGSMPTNYECKVMVILISSARSAEKKNDRNKTWRKRLSIHRPSPLRSRGPSSVCRSFRRSRGIHYSEHFSHTYPPSVRIARKIIETQYVCRLEAARSPRC